MTPIERPYHSFTVPAIGLALTSLCAVLFVFDKPAYEAVLTVWMLRPFPQPFIDWQFVTAAVDCWSHGIDVYTAIPCYDVIPTIAYPYSPLLLRFSFLPTDPALVAALGVGLVGLFWLTLAYFPAPRTRWELTVTLLAVLSSLTVFAIERANFDVVIFLLALLGVALWLGPLPSRLLAYSVFLVAGLLKFYPLILLGFALRERPRIFTALVVIVSAILIGCVVGFHGELLAAIHNVPKGSYFTDLFGAVNLPFGLPVLLSYVASKLGIQTDDRLLSWISLLVLVGVVSFAWFGASRLAFQAGLQEAVAALSKRGHALLVAGAALTCGCFFAGQSVGYRAIFLILLLPGLLELRRTLAGSGKRRVEAALWSIVFVMWVLTIEWLSASLGLTRRYDLGSDGFGLLHWLAHELAWWWIVTVLLATLVSFVSTSTIYRCLPWKAGQALA